MALNIADFSGGKFLKAAQLTEEGTAVTIEGVSVETMDDGSKKLALKVSGFDQTLVCNKTNLNRLAVFFAETDAEKWVGKRFIMYQDHTEYQSQYVPCIRVKKAPAPVAAVSADAAAGDDAIAI